VQIGKIAGETPALPSTCAIAHITVLLMALLAYRGGHPEGGSKQMDESISLMR
jgi:hypothetical protein